jgi:BlaI family penicillinase repressor
MEDYKLGAMETKFAELIWDSEPIPSGDLVKLCDKEFSWKKSTTYTMLRRLCERGIFQNEGGTVSSVLSKQEFNALQSEKFVEETFDGSLPQFLAAFTLRKKLSEKEINELQKLIDEKRGEF